MRSSTILAIICCLVPTAFLCFHADNFTRAGAMKDVETVSDDLQKVLRFEMSLSATEKALTKLGFKAVEGKGGKKLYEKAPADTSFSHIAPKFIQLHATYQTGRLVHYEVNVRDNGITFGLF